jgi:7-carboxy-7-deazaguanine synthase
VSVETQGSVWRPWLADVDRLVVSPKPPSSGMATAEHADQTSRFLEQALAARGPARSPVLKIVVGGEDDYEWAAHVHVLWPTLPLYLSALTDQFDRPVSDAAVRQALAVSYRRLCERAAGDERMHDVVVLPQLHVIAWGARMGV